MKFEICEICNTKKFCPRMSFSPATGNMSVSLRKTYVDNNIGDMLARSN